MDSIGNELAKQAGLSGDWSIVDRAPINPSENVGAPPNPNLMNSYFQGSLNPVMQHDAVFVGTEYQSPRVPQSPLMPVSAAGIPNVNSAIKSGGKTIPQTVTIPASVDVGDLTWRGTWVSSTSYNQNDLVQFDISTYICLLGNTNVEPDTDTTRWALVSENLHFKGLFQPGFNVNSNALVTSPYPPGLSNGTDSYPSGSLTTLNAQDFVVLFAHCTDATTITFPAGFTQRDSLIFGNLADAVADFPAPTPGTATYTPVYTVTTAPGADASLWGATITAAAGTVAFKRITRNTSNGTNNVTVNVGDIVLIYGRWGGTSAGTITVSDNVGNSYTQLGYQTYAAGGPSTVAVALFVGRITTGGAITITITNSQASTGFINWLVEYSGTPQASFPYDTVEYRGSTYVCVHQSSSDPITDSSNWIQLSQGSGFVNSQTVSYAALAGDYGKLISMNGSGLTLTLPNPPPQAAWWIAVENRNLTSLAIARNGLTIDGAAANLTVFQNQGVVIFTDGLNYFTMRGGLSSAPILVYSQTTPTTPLGATNLLASAPPGLYRVSFYSVVTTAGVGGTSFSLNFIYTDVKQAQTVAAFTNSTFAAGNVNEGDFIIQNQGTANIQYSLTEVGVFGTHPVLALYMTLERLN